MSRLTVNILVGVFVILAGFSLFVLAFNVSGVSLFGAKQSYLLTMEFDNIGGLKARAPVSVGGVVVGRVIDIKLNKEDFRAVVRVSMEDQYRIPVDSSASILTEGLLGSNYIGITPGYQTKNIKAGGEIITTHSALVLENLIGQLLFSLKKDDTHDKNKEQK